MGCEVQFFGLTTVLSPVPSCESAYLGAPAWVGSLIDTRLPPREEEGLKALPKSKSLSKVWLGVILSTVEGFVRVRFLCPHR